MGTSESRLPFTADLFTLSKQYYDIVMHIRESNLFRERNELLQKSVQKYLEDVKNFDHTNMDLLAVDTSHKLHPLDYNTSKVNKEYLINACLRQDEFCRKLHVKCLNFEDTLKNYEKFLKVIKTRPGTITVPSLNEDFMWHSHMLDHQSYKKDTKTILGFILNHDDEIPKEKLKNYWNDALDKRQNVYGHKFGEYKIAQSNPNHIKTNSNECKTNQTSKYEPQTHDFMEICLKTKAS